MRKADLRASNLKKTYGKMPLSPDLCKHLNHKFMGSVIQGVLIG